MSPTLARQAVSEFIGTFALIFIGVGAIHNNTAGSGMGLLGVALAHGLTIAVMVTAVGGICGGQLNPAVTFGLWVGGKMETGKSVVYVVAQLLGATSAAFLLLGLLSDPLAPGQSAAKIVAQGTPALAPHVSAMQGVVIEAVLTFFLVFVVYGSAVDSRSPRLGGLAIGFTVTLDILFGGPLTGAAMNPARTFGPALASGAWSNHWVYWAGPLLGGGLAGIVYGRYLIHQTK
jgi:MIP family channel proteins